MSSRFFTRYFPVCLNLCLLALAQSACSSEAKKARHLERGDEYFTQEEYQEAILEYRNVLQIEQDNAHAIQRLAIAHYERGEVGQAFPFLVRAKELEPESLEVRRRLGIIYLLGRRLEDARQEALEILEREPEDLDALVLLADAAQTPEEADELLVRMEGLRDQFDGQAKFHLAMGNLHIKKKDIDSAEREFTEAAEREPGSVIAHQSLGNFYLAKRDLVQAEREFKAAAELDEAGPETAIRLADFYLVAGKREESKDALEAIVQDSPDFLPARHRLAAMALDAGHLDESLETVEAILAQNELDPVGLALRGRIHLAHRETNEAIQDFQKILELQPKHAPTRYQLARAQIQAGNIQQAKSELRDAVISAPGHADAVFLLAQLNIQTDAPEPAIEDLTSFIEGHPQVARAHQLLGSAYLQNQDPTRATQAFRRFAQLAPEDPRGPYFIGLALQAGGKTAKAGRQFQASLEMLPDFAEPLERLVSMDFSNNRADAALERVRKQIGLVPESGALYLLLGRTHRQRRELSEAETAFLKAVDLEPRLVAAYTQLGSLYASMGSDDHALAKFNDALGVNPNDMTALMLSGVIYQRRGEVSQAQDRYERVLEINPQFAPAANNLAYLYAEQGGDPEKALELAQRAKEIAPEDPSISDTLGWILSERGLHRRALGLLQESVEKRPENAEMHYHLGMTLFRLDDKEAAGRALAKALELDANFPGAQEARRVLEELE